MSEALEPGEVRVYYSATHGLTDDQRERGRAMLDDGERARHLRFRFAEDRDAYLAAHALTRAVLARQLGVAPSALRFEHGPHGRPELAWPAPSPRLRFNLSHTRGLVACALALEHDIGVDVEHVQRRVEIELLAKNVFSETERAELLALAGEPQRRRFFELWTLKEAYIKAVGKGLALPLPAIDIQLAASRAPTIAFATPIGDDGARWFLHLSEPVPSFLLAVALAAPAARARCNVTPRNPFEYDRT
jgi:4'-phosphopantetheinyl transferase